MKIKITLLVGKLIKNLHISDPRHLEIYLDEEMNFPCGYISTKSEKETVNEILSKYFHVDPEWLNVNLTGFRVLDRTEAEIVYTITIPQILGVNKSGAFFSCKELQRQGKEIDEYYEPLITRRTSIV